LDLLIGLPVSYALTLANKSIIQYLGYEKLMRSPGGVLFSRLLFVGLNMAIVLTWAMQLVQEQREALMEQKIKLWDERLERMDEQVRRVRERVSSASFSSVCSSAAKGVLIKSPGRGRSDRGVF
jgi:hypothetical protein